MPISCKDVVLLTVSVAGFAVAGVIMTNKLNAQPEDAPISREQYRENLLAEYDLSNPAIQIEDILVPGRIGRDGIPAITDPKLVPARDATYPADDDRVIQVSIGDDAVAFPLGILNFHEIVNANVGGTPIAATYCPLCDSVALFDRRLDGQTLEFGVSGLLYNSNVVMYERNTRGLWSQVFMQAVTGTHARRSLQHLPVNVITFDAFKKAFPDGRVQSPDTGHNRNYTRNPYEPYFADEDRVYHAFDYDDRLPPKALGVGIRAGNTIVFVQADAAEDSPITIDTDSGPITISATGAGIEIENLPDGADAIQTFYHSWAAFFPETTIVPEPEPTPED